MSLTARPILVVDDGLSKPTLAELLSEHGITAVDVEEDGEAAWVKLRAAPYELVVCSWDLQHPGSVELLRRLRACPETAHLPFLVVCGPVSSHGVHELVDAGPCSLVARRFVAEAVELRLKLQAEFREHATAAVGLS